MAVCYFNKDFTRKYECSYEMIDSGLVVAVKYSIEDEIEYCNGIKVFGSNTEFEDRDILVIDHNNKKSYLLKEAFYSGHTSVYGNPDGGCTTKFTSRVVISSSSYESLSELPTTPRTNRIRIYSNLIVEAIGHPSVERIHYEDRETINLIKNKELTAVDIGKHNIKRLAVGDDWVCRSNSKTINIEISGYIEIILTKTISYETVAEYVNELITYMQLYKIGQFEIEKLMVQVNQKYYELYIPLMEIEHIKRSRPGSVECGLLKFLETCYEQLSIRKGRNAIRNVQHIIAKHDRNIEDTFLSYYRFIECYYKGLNEKGVSNKFISKGINDHVDFKQFGFEEDEESIVAEIISLRNHYVHSGYHIKNGILKIKYPKYISNRENYTATQVDFEWIYNRAILLKRITIDIIFKSMLGFESYTYEIQGL